MTTCPFLVYIIIPYSHLYSFFIFTTRGIPWRANNTDDIDAVERHAAFQIGVFADPIFVTGDWPQILKDTLPPDYLPRLTEEEKKDIQGILFYSILYGFLLS